MTDSFELGFPSGQFAAHRVDLDTAMALEEAFHRGSDPQPIIDSIADPVVRAAAQRISDKLAQHPGRGQGSSPDFINWGYVTERVRRYNQQPSDDLLYRLGTHIDALTPEDQSQIQYHQQGNLNPRQRFNVLNWLACQGFEIEGDLALHIFGREQLTEWLERSLEAYPGFEFFLVFEFQPKEKTGWDSGINFTLHWIPQPGAPEPSVECDFAWSLYWESGDLFWADWMPGHNQFELSLDCYPHQDSFATPNSFCEEGDRYTTLTDEEMGLLPVAQVLEHFATVPA